MLPTRVSAEVEYLPRSDVVHSEPGGTDELQDVILADEVPDTEGEKVGVGAVHEKVDDAGSHPLVALLDEVGLEIVVEFARHRG